MVCRLGDSNKMSILIDIVTAIGAFIVGVFITLTMWMVGFMFTSRLYQTRELREFYSAVPRWESVESMIAMWPAFLWKIPKRVEEHREMRQRIEQEAEQVIGGPPLPDHEYEHEPPNEQQGEDANPHPRRNVP